MNPEQIINQIWTMHWYEVIQIALMDGLILLVKTWPFLLVSIFIFFGTLLLIEKNKKYRITSLKSKCLLCEGKIECGLPNHKPCGKVIITISDISNEDFCIVMHHNCAKEYMKKLIGNVEGLPQTDEFIVGVIASELVNKGDLIRPRWEIFQCVPKNQGG